MKGGGALRAEGGLTRREGSRGGRAHAEGGLTRRRARRGASPIGGKRCYRAFAWEGKFEGGMTTLLWGWAASPHWDFDAGRMPSLLCLHKTEMRQPEDLRLGLRLFLFRCEILDPPLVFVEGLAHGGGVVG